MASKDTTIEDALLQAWYRAGRALYGQGNLEGALAAFRCAEKRQLNLAEEMCHSGTCNHDSPKKYIDEGLVQWIRRCELQWQCERRRQRSSIDYTRFEKFLADIKEEYRCVHYTSLLFGVVYPLWRLNMNVWTSTRPPLGQLFLVGAFTAL